MDHPTTKEMSGTATGRDTAAVLYRLGRVYVNTASACCAMQVHNN